MATPKKTAELGERFAEGIVCRLHDNGVLLGRPASADEPLEYKHTEFFFDGQRVIMHDESAPHPVAALHKRG